MLALRLLGPPEILLDGHPVEIKRRKSRALIYYLAVHERPVPRDRLVNLLWASSPSTSARQLLRTTLYGLRKALGEALSGEEDLALRSPLEIDARQFEETLRQKQQSLETLQKTLALYRGEFLQGFTFPEEAAFEEWALFQREHYHRLYLQGLEQVSQAYAAQGDYPQAVEPLERALADDPLQEDLQREVMRLLYLSGDRPAAILRYDAVRRLLDQELGVPPMQETRQLYDAILADRVPAPAARPASPAAPARRTGSAGAQAFEGNQEIHSLPFTGRQVELDTLRALPPGRLGLIAGEPGIGKTRLAQEYLRQTPGIHLSGAGRELEASLPYQPLIEALRSLANHPEWPRWKEHLARSLPGIWLSEAARLLPELDSGAAQAAFGPVQESRLWEAVSQLLHVLAQEARLTLFIDDLHWVDSASLGMLAYLVRHSPGSPLYFLATSRPNPPRSPAGNLLYNLDRLGRLERLELTRMERQEIQAISLQISPAYAQPLADWLESQSEGNPLVLAELIRHARQSGLLASAKPGEPLALNLSALSSQPVVPRPVYSLFQSRLANLSETAQRLLGAAVSAGREFEFELVARAAALSEGAALEALDELRGAGLFVPLDELHFAFDHPFTMEVAYRELGEPRHRLFHRRVAEAMESLYSRSRKDALARVIAFHYQEGLAPDKAAPYALLAGNQAAALGAWGEAADRYREALSGIETPKQLAVWMSLGEVLANAGQSVRAAEAYQHALDLALQASDQDRAAQARLELASALIFQARYPETIQLARQVQQTGPPEYHARAEVLWGTALSLEGADLDEAARHLKNAQSLCQRANQPRPGEKLSDAEQKWISIQRGELAHTEFELGNIAAQRGDLEAAVQQYQRALDISCSQLDTYTIPWCILSHNNLAYHLHLLNRPDAEEFARKGLSLAEEHGMMGQIPFLLSTLGEIALDHGELAAAEENFRRGLDLAEEQGSAERIAGLTANLGRLADRRGEGTVAIHYLSSALSLAEHLGIHHLVAQVRLWLAPLLPPAEARNALAAVRAFAEQRGSQRLLEEIRQVEKRLTYP